MTASVSLLTAAAAAAYLVAPTQLAIAIEVQAATTSVPAGRVVVYGTAVDQRDRPLGGASIKLGHVSAGKFVTDLSLTSRSDGTFRKQAKLVARRYAIRAAVAGKAVKANSKSVITIKPGHAYKIRIAVVRTGVVHLVPVRTY